MRHGARIAAAIELLTQIHQSWDEGKRAPVDAMLADYYGARRYMGSKDRGAVSELIYFILRHGGCLQWWLEEAKSEATPRQIVLAALILGFEKTLPELKEEFSGSFYCPRPLNNPEQKLVEYLIDQPLIAAEMPAWAKLNVPNWLLARLKKEFKDDFESEMKSMNLEAHVDLRVNTIKCPDRGDLIMALDREGFYASPTPFSELGVRMKKRMPVFTLEIFRQGWFEMQDEGSQIVAELVDAKAGDKVIDFCAGAGGKTLAIAAKMQNKGRLLAWDIHEKRLNQIRKRLARAGVDNVTLQVLESENDAFVKRHKDSADWVLVDAPCSGSGTWRRNPDLKWRLTPKDLDEVKAVQQQILASACRLVKPGTGRLVYATCSLFAEENQQQIEAFLVEHPDFRVEPLPEIWNKHALDCGNLGQALRLSPHRDGTDGFFAMILSRL